VADSLHGKAEVSPHKAAKIIKDYFSGGSKFASLYAAPRRSASPARQTRGSLSPQ
jgi:hypothetical protein